MHQQMHMVRRHAPFQEPIALSIEMQQRVLDDLRASWIAKDTGSMPRILVACNPLAEFLVSQVVFQRPAHSEFTLPPFDHLFRQGIGEAKCDRLLDFRSIKVRKEST